MALSSQHAPLPVLALAPDAVRGLDGREAVAALWTGACLPSLLPRILPFPASSLLSPYRPALCPPPRFLPLSHFPSPPRIQSIR